MKKKLILSLIALSLMTTSSYAVNEITSSPSVNRVALPDFSPIYDSVGKSVVNITVTQAVPGQMPGFSTGDPFFDYFLRRMVPPQQQRQYKAHGLGSGFIISTDGYILTNAHVVANAEQVVVKLNNKREFKAKIIGIDRDTDVAVLKIAAAGLPVVKFGDPNKMKPGNWVLAIGAPFGLENTITQGIISALSRDLPDDSYVPFIQTDVPINPGNSGGPLINLNGEIIGMNSQIYSKSGGYMGISFAIPIDYAVKVADQLKATGKVKRGRLGIAIQPITSELAKSFGLAGTNGALVNSVEANSAAAKAGLQVGDIILKINGQFITNSNLLPRLVGQLGPDKKLNLEVWRNGKTITLTAVTTEAVPAPTIENATPAPHQQQLKQISRLGIVVSELAPVTKLPAGFKYGLVVQGVNDNAQFAGVMPGDIIVGIGNHNLSDFNDFVNYIAKYKEGNVIALKILRSDGRRFWTVFIPITVMKD
jgi:serine protease Do